MFSLVEECRALRMTQLSSLDLRSSLLTLDIAQTISCVPSVASGITERALFSLTRSLHLFGFKFLDLFEELVDDVGTVVGMGLAITLDGITVVGITGDHKEH